MPCLRQPRHPHRHGEEHEAKTATTDGLTSSSVFAPCLIPITGSSLLMKAADPAYGVPHECEDIVVALWGCTRPGRLNGSVHLVVRRSGQRELSELLKTARLGS